MKKKKINNIKNDTDAIISKKLSNSIEKNIKDNPVSQNGDLFLDENTSLEIEKEFKNISSVKYFSSILNEEILLVGYYRPNFLSLKEQENFNNGINLSEKKNLIKHIYYSLSIPLSPEKLSIENVKDEFKKNKNDFISSKTLKKLNEILNRKNMNSEGYIFLTENERDQLGKDFLINNKRIHLDNYVNQIQLAGVKQEVEFSMEKRYTDYTFDELTKSKNLNTIVYPVFDDEKVKGRSNKSGMQTTDKKQLPLYFWFTIMSICFIASICILIWVFGFVLPASGAANGSFETSSHPIDGALVIQSLFPNAWTFLSHIAASITIFFFLFFMAWRPMKEMVEKRENYIANQISTAEKLNKIADIKLEYATRQELLSYARSNEIIENAIRTVNLKKENIEKEAKLNADEIRNSAIEDTKKIHEKLKNNINDEIVNNSLLIASELLKRNVSSDDNQQFVDDFIKNLESRNKDNV